MALEWRDAVERMDVYLKERLSSGLLLLHAELGVDVGLKAELLPPGLLACVAAGLGLLLALLLCCSVCRCFSKKTSQRVALEVGKTSKPKSEEVKKRSRKRGGEKKVQRNGQPVDLEEELKPVETQNLNQNQSESPDPAGGKSEKGKKNKKKTKAQVKETKSASERREPEEGTWETKVSQREKRQQRRKDKGAGDESGSPGGTEIGTDAANTEHVAAAEEPKIISSPSVNSKTTNITTTTKTTKISNPITTTKSSNTNTTSSNTTSKSSTPTTFTTDSTKNTKRSPTPATKAQKNSPRTQRVVVPAQHDPPVAEVTRAQISPVSPTWDVIGVNGSGSWDLGVSVPPHSQTWNSSNPETSVWPQDMEGSWMMVDGSHIPVSLHGMTGGVPESSWACPAPVDDEWSGPSERNINSGSADPGSDYCAPCEEWGNYEEPAGGAVPTVEPQDSDPEKDRDELAAPGSSKAKKKKKKKKKAEEAGSAAQVEEEVGGAKEQKAAGNMLPKDLKEQDVMASPPVLLKPTEPEAPPTQKKPEESLEPQKQVKKKKARRET